MNDKIKINLRIADVYFPITINREDEELMRNAAKEVNLKIGKYEEHYKGLERDKILIMVAFQFAHESLLQKQRNDIQPYTQKFKELSDLLSEYLLTK